MAKSPKSDKKTPEGKAQEHKAGHDAPETAKNTDELKGLAGDFPGKDGKVEDTAADAPPPDAPRDPKPEPGEAPGTVAAPGTRPDDTETIDAALIEAAADTPQAAETPSRTAEEPAPHIGTAPAPLPAPPSGRGAGGLILGGVIAALIGAGALYAVQSQGWVTLGGPDEELLARIDSLESDLGTANAALAAAQKDITALAEAEPDLSAVTAAIGKVQGAADATSADLAALTERLNTTDKRLSDLAVTQIPEAELPKAISDAYDAKLSDLLASIDTRFTEMQKGLNTKLTELEQSQTDAARAEADALRAARMAEARAAMGKVGTALDTGVPYAEPLAEVADLSGASVPGLLSEHAEEGIPTLNALRESFPGNARRALTLSSRAAAESGEMSRWEAFLRTQTGARSLEARDGNDPDAVLSRAEAALDSGDLDTALTELNALPDAGRQAMADWAALAETRRDVLNAAADLATQLEQN